MWKTRRVVQFHIHSRMVVDWNGCNNDDRWMCWKFRNRAFLHFLADLPWNPNISSSFVMQWQNISRNPLRKILTIKGSHFIFLNLLWSFMYLRNLIRSLQILTSNIQFFHQTLPGVFFFTLLKTWLPTVTLPGDQGRLWDNLGLGRSSGPPSLAFWCGWKLCRPFFFGVAGNWRCWCSGTKRWKQKTCTQKST